MRSEAESLSPRTIGRYVLYGEIAVGGMATVHFGRLIGQAGFARSVAIKRLHAHYARDPEFVAMFLDEARLAARIVHPNVVPTLDVVVVDNELFLVMEYVRGASLSRLLRAARAQGETIPLPIVSSIFAGALHGLHAAHEAKNERGERLDIVHRDISPQNVMVGTDGAPRVLDFGVAKAIGRSQTTRDGQLKGKLAYMAPEQMRGETVTRRTDVYAAAVVLWESLTGVRLFKAENEGNLVAQVLSGKVSPPSSIVPGLPGALDALVMRGLELDPASRFATARDMASELVACIPGAPADEVGAWVETHAAEELHERASRIADIERDSSVSQARQLSPAAGPADAPTPLGRREREPATISETLLALPGSIGDPSRAPREVGSQVSSVSVSHPSGRPAEGPRKLPWIGVAVVATVAIAGGFVLFRVGTHSTAKGETVSPATEPPSAETALPAAESAMLPLPPTTGASPAAPAPSATGVGADSSEPVASARPSPRPARGGAGPSHPTAKPDCTPPYTTDDHGHVHFKPACL
jgi:serine/threonine protein kinase